MRSRRRFAFLLGIGFALLSDWGWPDNLAAQGQAPPENWDVGVKPVEAVDRNPHPRIVEIDLDARVARVEIAPGRTVEAWTYDGGLPGPLIRVRVGDRLIVHFLNHLPQPTTIHWHGLRIPIAMDGVPGVSQPEVIPGGSFTYEFVVPDAGLFWYHPHVMSAAQVGFGLYGALLVEDPLARIDIADELVMVLSDIELTPDGALESPETGGSAGMVFGREGNHVLVNGRTDRRMTVRPGVPQRWRILNAAKSRYFDLNLDGMAFTKIGGDGGLQEYPEELERLVIAPGERADVIVTPRGRPGTEATLLSNLYNRGYGSVETRFPFEELLTIAFADMPSSDRPPPTLPRGSIEPLATTGAGRVSLDFTVDKLSNGTLEYRVNGVAFSANKPLRANPGESQIWTLTNKTKWSHPFHLHGFFFQVLDQHGDPVRPLAWKDTVNVPFEQSVQIIVRFDDRPGDWMYHCHVLDHADGGLMGTVIVGGAVRGHMHGRGGTSNEH